jgi:hypothetical protein
MISLPGKLPAGKRLTNQVRLLDIVPTILDILDIRPWTHLEGVSLLPIIDGTGDPDPGGANLLPHRFAYSEAMLYGDEKKCLTAHPWKLIYDTASREMELMNLSSDPGETADLAGAEPEIKTTLEEVLMKTLLATSETWFVEVESGERPHIFDLKVGLMKEPISGTFGTYRVLDSEGRMVNDDLGVFAETGGNVLKIESLEIEKGLTMAFTAEPQLTPVIFDFRIDGRPAESITFLGGNLSQPEAMPFVEQATRRSRIMGDPAGRPDPPYILVWHSTDPFGASTEVRLRGGTERELRALGYIQ